MVKFEDKNDQNITQLLTVWAEGDLDVQDKLIQKLYPYIHQIAHLQKYNNYPGALQTTEIVHEAFIKLNDQKQVNWASRNHFLAIAAKVIRRVVVDHFRSEHNEKRGGHGSLLTLDRVSEQIIDQKSISFDWLELNDLLSDFEKIDPDSAQMIELRFYGGLTMKEISDVMGVSTATISRNWQFAKSWLLVRLDQ